MAIDAEGMWAAAHGGAPAAPTPAELAPRLNAYRSTIARSIGHLDWQVDGTTYAGFFEALADPSSRFDTVVLRGPDAPAHPAWEFLRPFTRLEMWPDGRSTLTPPIGPPETGIVRLLPREGFPDRRPGTDRAPLTWKAFVATVRPGGRLPFGIALELYCANERVRYEIDLVDSQLLADPRAGRLPRGSRVHWSARAAWRLDHLIGRLDLPPESARLVELIAEMDSLSGRDIARVLDGPGAEALLPSLASAGLVGLDPGTDHWRFRREALGPAIGDRRAASRPALHRSMDALLDAADSRATCPMCGEEFPPGPHGLLCRRCEREVAGPNAR